MLASALGQRPGRREGPGRGSSESPASPAEGSEGGGGLLKPPPEAVVYTTPRRLPIGASLRPQSISLRARREGGLPETF